MQNCRCINDQSMHRRVGRTAGEGDPPPLIHKEGLLLRLHLCPSGNPFLVTEGAVSGMDVRQPSVGVLSAVPCYARTSVRPPAALPAASGARGATSKGPTRVARRLLVTAGHPRRPPAVPGRLGRRRRASGGALSVWLSCRPPSSDQTFRPPLSRGRSRRRRRRSPSRRRRSSQMSVAQRPHRRIAGRYGWGRSTDVGAVTAGHRRHPGRHGTRPARGRRSSRPFA